MGAVRHGAGSELLPYHSWYLVFSDISLIALGSVLLLSRNSWVLGGRSFYPFRPLIRSNIYILCSYSPSNAFKSWLSKGHERLRAGLIFEQGMANGWLSGYACHDSATCVFSQMFHHKWQLENNKNTIYFVGSQLEFPFSRMLVLSFWASNFPQDTAWKFFLLSAYHSVPSSWCLLYFIRLFCLFQDPLLFFNFFQFYWDIIDIHHYLNLSYTAQWFDLHIWWNDYHNKFS